MQLYYHYFLFKANQHKAAGMKIRLSKNNDYDGVSHGVECSQEGDRIPPWRAIDKRWNRNTVSLVSSVMAVMRLPIYWISSVVDWFQYIYLVIIIIIVCFVLYVLLLFICISICRWTEFCDALCSSITVVSVESCAAERVLCIVGCCRSNLLYLFVFARRATISSRLQLNNLVRLPDIFSRLHSSAVQQWTRVVTHAESLEGRGMWKWSGRSHCDAPHPSSSVLYVVIVVVGSGTALESMRQGRTIRSKFWEINSIEPFFHHSFTNSLCRSWHSMMHFMVLNTTRSETLLHLNCTKMHSMAGLRPELVKALPDPRLDLLAYF